LRALRNDRVTLVEKGSPQSLCLMESGKVLCFSVIPVLIHSVPGLKSCKDGSTKHGYNE